MRPAHPNMYGQPTYVLPPNPGVQYYTTANSPLPQYVRNSQELQQPQQQQQQLQPMYLVQPQMHQYPALVGVPTQVVGNPMPQAMAIQGVPGGWAYSRPAMAEPAPMWGYGGRGYNEQQQQQQQETRNWQPAPSQGYSGFGFQGRMEAPGNGGGIFQGRVEAPGNGGGIFQGRVEAPGNGGGNFQGRAGNMQSFVGKPSGGEVRRSDRGFENSRHYSSGGGAPGRSQYGNRQAQPPLQSKQLNCEPCEKTFAVYAQYTAHMNTHVPCDDPGCSFSASGKVVKEHKLTVHYKSSNPNPMRKKSGESKAEIRAWREERRRNYPTRLNIQRKKDILEGKVARGELIDEDARQRRKRMKEILARQAELGLPVAEVPAHYLSNKDDRARGRKISDRSEQRPASNASAINSPDLKKRKLGEDDATVTTEEHPSKSARMNTDPSTSHSNSSAELPTQAECENPEEVKVVPPEAGSQPLEKAPKAPCYFYQRGRCKKGSKCHFAHVRSKKGGDESTRRGRPQKGAVSEKKRPPTLLSKLLQPEITRDKSCILQCLRFFVNNNFLLDGIVELPSESESEESSYYSEGEVVEAPDVLLADAAIINTLLSERPEVLAKVLEMETQT